MVRIDRMLLRFWKRAPNSRGRGRLGEAAAARWLEAQGYRILGRNLLFPVGELDIVARQGETVCFVEVKARRTRRFGSGREALSASKRHRLLRAAAWWCQQSAWRGPCRFDLLALDWRAGRWRMTLLQNAFEAPEEG